MKTNSELKNRAIDALTGKGGVICHDALYSERLSCGVAMDMKYDAAIEKSMAMMSGHKMKMFLLDLSFIGWAILVLFYFGDRFLVPGSLCRSITCCFL